MFDIKAVEKEAKEEIQAERANAAKAKLKAKLAEINRTEKILATQKMEYEVLLKDISLEV